SRKEVVGLNLWTNDQSRNRPEATRGNLVAERRDRSMRIEDRRHTGHAIPDASFDLVVNSMAVHNIAQNDPRHHDPRLQAIDEGVRSSSGRPPARGGLLERGPMRNACERRACST